MHENKLSFFFIFIIFINKTIKIVITEITIYFRNEGLNTPQPPGKKRKVKKLDDVDEAILKSLKDLEEKRTQPQDTEEDLFDKQVAVVLNRLHPRQKAMAKLHIQQLLTDIEISFK